MVRPSQSTAETEPKLQPAFLEMVSDAGQKSHAGVGFVRLEQRILGKKKEMGSNLNI
jgi:hypothetical protein